jgi:hypothetical protein
VRPFPASSTGTSWRPSELVGILVSDLDAMIFGMPRAVFPALAENVFRGGPATYGPLSAASGVGALVGASPPGGWHRCAGRGWR